MPTPEPRLSERYAGEAFEQLLNDHADLQGIVSVMCFDAFSAASPGPSPSPARLSTESTRRSTMRQRGSSVRRLRRVLFHAGVASTFLFIGLLFIPAARFLLWLDPSGAELKWAVDAAREEWPAPPLYFVLFLLVVLGAALGWCWHDLAPWIYRSIVGEP